MNNVLSEEQKQQVLALGRLGLPHTQLPHSRPDSQTALFSNPLLTCRLIWIAVVSNSVRGSIRSLAAVAQLCYQDEIQTTLLAAGHKNRLRDA